MMIPNAQLSYYRALTRNTIIAYSRPLTLIDANLMGAKQVKMILRPTLLEADSLLRKC
jgi:hypothetical protein